MRSAIIFGVTRLKKSDSILAYMYTAFLLQTGRMDLNYPKVTGHKGPVLDVQFNPFDDNEIASASDDCSIKIWTIPDGGFTTNMEEAKVALDGHGKKVCTRDNYYSCLTFFGHFIMKSGTSACICY